MASRTSNLSFVKFRHKTLVFTRSNITALQKSKVLSGDLISLVFLMCGDDQIEEMFSFLKAERCHLDSCLASIDLFSVFKSFPDWERKLPVALLAIENVLALSKLDISRNDARMITKSSILCPLRMALYRISDSLSLKERNRFISEMVLPDDLPPSDLPQLELDFMHWHTLGVFDLRERDTLDKVARSLEAIGRHDLAVFASPQVVQDHDFDSEYPLTSYEIKDEKNPGLCLIVNQVRYGGKKLDRGSSLVNSENLCRVMEDFLNFTVVTLEDLSEAEFCNKIKTTVKTRFLKEHSIFLLIIMAHGEQDGIICPMGTTDQLEKEDHSFLLEKDRTVKGDGLGIVQVADVQASLFECEELERIPKVLLLNCCRGGFEFTARNYFKMEADAPGKHPLPSHVDIITCYSALPNFVSWRDSKGSAFLNLFCDILAKKPDMEICHIFTLMNARLMQPTPDMSRVTERYGGFYKLAMPFDFTSSLRMRLYFKLPKAVATSS